MSDRCELTELIVDQCAHCTGATSIQEQADIERLKLRAHLTKFVPGWFAAQYPGTCFRCATQFGVEGAIRREPTATGVAYVAECCAEIEAP